MGGLAATGFGDKPPEDSMWVFSFWMKFNLWTGRKGPRFLRLHFVLGQIPDLQGTRRFYSVFSSCGELQLA